MPKFETPAEYLQLAALAIESRAARHWSAKVYAFHADRAVKMHYAKQGYFLAAWLRNIAREQSRTPETAKTALQGLCAAKGPKGHELSYLLLRTFCGACELVDIRDGDVLASEADWLQCARSIRLDLLSEWQRCVWRELWEYST